MSPHGPVTIVGGGLAGSEAAWQLAEGGQEVVLFEMRPKRSTEAHSGGKLAELVCSNSFRSDNPHNAIGILHRELRAASSLILRAADNNRVPAGDALAMDREGFAAEITGVIEAHPLIEVRREEVTQLPEGDVILATGPLTSPALSQIIGELTGREHLAFFDAIAPILDAESIDLEKVFAASRYGKGDGDDYINCPFTRDEYTHFVVAIRDAELVESKDFEKDTPHFQGCLPLEVMVAQGMDTPRFGPMKPVGLTDPNTGQQPWAVVQLRRENLEGTAYNMVGFQTKMKYGEQKRIFRMIPGLENVVFHRMGSVHRNTFIDSPKLLDAWMALKSNLRVRFAGQITGVEGYVESTACGLLVAWSILAERKNTVLTGPPPETALGAMMGHLRECYTGHFQPQNVNFGLFPPLGQRMKRAQRRQAYCERARSAFDTWLGDTDVIRPMHEPGKN